MGQGLLSLWLSVSLRSFFNCGMCLAEKISAGQELALAVLWSSFFMRRPMPARYNLCINVMLFVIEFAWRLFLKSDL